MAIHPACFFGGILLAGMAVLAPALAQDENPTTPGAIANPGSYQGSMALQQQEQQQYQQQEQQNQQMLQHLNQNYQQYGAGQSGGGAAGRAAPQVDWWSKPALDPARNPLMGRWHQVANRLSGSQNAIAALAGTVLSGGCNSIFGKGVVAFEPNALQWVAPDGHEEILNHVAYRANGQDVVMITRDAGALPSLAFGFPSHDRVVVGGLNCVLERVGDKPNTAPAASNGVPAPQPSVPPGAQAQAATSAANAVLHFQIGTGATGTLANIQIWVTREDPETGLARAGIVPGGNAMPDANALAKKLTADCRDTPSCIRDWKAMTATALGSIRTDAAGRAQTPSIPAGRYYLVGFAPLQDKGLFWRQPIELKPGSNAVTLDQTNASLLVR